MSTSSHLRSVAARSSLMLALVLASLPAAAQAPATTGEGEQPAAALAPTLGESPGTGPVLSLSVFSINEVAGSFSGVASSFSGLGTTSGLLPSLAPVVQVGLGVGQVAALVGFGLGAIGGGGGSGTTFLVSGSATLRYYIRPLIAGNFSPFGEGTIGLGIAGSAPDIAFDVGGGLGGEWLFVKNFGLFGRATVVYEHINTGGNVDGIGLVGDVGLTAHL